jgi:hypothetical protein
VSCAEAVTRGPRRDETRAFWASLSVAEAMTSNTASTREAVTFACWPPGPDDRLVRNSTSATGIARPGRICSSSGIEGEFVHIRRLGNRATSRHHAG